MLDGSLLRAFVAFSATMNFTKAARAIGLSQPALFERVRKLEDALELKLYAKEGRALTLTPQGVEVAAFARTALSSAERFCAKLRGEVSESVTLAAGEGAYLYLLGPALAKIRPPQALRLLTLGGPDSIAAVRTAEAHLAVGVFDLKPRGLMTQPILQTPLCAALPRGHPLAAKPEIQLSDLAEERLILAPEGRSQRKLVGRALARIGAQAAAERGESIEADGWALMLAFVKARLGVAVVNGICHPPAGVVLRPIPELGTVRYQVVCRREPLPELAQRLMEAILALA